MIYIFLNYYINQIKSHQFKPIVPADPNLVIPGFWVVHQKQQMPSIM